MLFQKFQMFFNEPDYVTVHSVMNIILANGAKIVQKNPTTFLSYYYVALV